MTTAGREQKREKQAPRWVDGLLFCHSRGAGSKWGGSRNAGIHLPRVVCLMKQQTEETWIPDEIFDEERRGQASGMTGGRTVVTPA